MNWLKELLEGYVEAEKVDEFVEKFNKENPKHFMPKDKFNEVSEELRIKKAQIEENNTILEGLKQKANSVEEYETKLKEMQDKYQELETNSQKEVSTITKKSQLKELLFENKMHKDAIDLFINSTNLDELEMEEGKLKDPNSFIEKVKSERSGLFSQTVEDSEDKGSGKENDSSVDDDAKLRQAMGL
jgi:hypothetical protein